MEIATTTTTTTTPAYNENLPVAGSPAVLANENRPQKRQRRNTKTPVNDEDERLESAENGAAAEIPLNDNADNSTNTSLYSYTPDAEWLQNLYAFNIFRSRHPNSNPNIKSKFEDEKRLAAWVKAQRKLHSTVKSGKGGNAAKRKIEVLEQLNNFPFAKPFSDRVEQRLDELRVFKEQHGHLHVPSRSGPLGRWLKMARVKYNQGKLDGAIITRLEEMGLEWSEWEAMYQELKEYKETHGNCVVPRREEFKRLNRWVTTQRQNYRVEKLSRYRITKLEEIGFTWLVLARGPNKVKAVEEQDGMVYGDYSCGY
jgi:hypothetical protein